MFSNNIINSSDIWFANMRRIRVVSSVVLCLIVSLAFTPLADVVLKFSLGGIVPGSQTVLSPDAVMAMAFGGSRIEYFGNHLRCLQTE